MTRGRLALATALTLVAAAGPAAAHDARPAFLQLTAQGPDRCEVLWKRPLVNGAPLDLQPVWPAAWRPVAAPRRRQTLDALAERWVVTVGDMPLAGARVSFPGLARVGATVLARVVRADGRVETSLVRADPGVLVVAAPPGTAAVALAYTRLGIAHIAFGIDHLCFVLGLLLIVPGRRALLWTITGFTLAHSVTLALAVCGVVHVPTAPVEAVIALSIVFLAGEIVHARQGHSGIAARRPWVVAVIFGLLHGFGFAGALSAVGLPAGEIATALACFNIGVELGQVAFVAAAGALILVGRRAWATPPAWGWRVAPYTIGAVAAWWAIARTLAIVA